MERLDKYEKRGFIISNGEYVRKIVDFFSFFFFKHVQKTKTNNLRNLIKHTMSNIPESTVTPINDINLHKIKWKRSSGMTTILKDILYYIRKNNEIVLPINKKLNDNNVVIK